MKKKIYEKPTMTVVILQHRTCLLQASGDTPKDEKPDAEEFDGWLG